MCACYVFPPRLAFSPLSNMLLLFMFTIVAAAADAHLAAIGAALVAAVAAAATAFAAAVTAGLLGMFFGDTGQQ